MGVSVRMVNGKMVADPFPTVPPHLQGKVDVYLGSESLTPPSPELRGYAHRMPSGGVPHTPSTTRRRTTTRRTTTRRHSLVGRGTPVRKTTRRKPSRVQRKSKRLTSDRNTFSRKTFGETKSKRSAIDDLW